MSNVNWPDLGSAEVCLHHFMCIAVNVLAAFCSLVVFRLAVNLGEQRSLERFFSGSFAARPTATFFRVLLERAMQCDSFSARVLRE